MDDSLCTLSASRLAALARAGEIGMVAIAEAFIERVLAHQHLNAIVRFDAEAVRAQAKALEALPRARASTLPLLGVPFTAKDNLWVAGRPVSQGSALFERFVAPEDAVCVARMRAAGALFLGTTNCSEFACKGVTTNRLFGPTRNPWDPSRTPGGSSGGAASACAAGLGPLALCTDGGGSTRRPASHAGVVGMKPSAGLVAHPVGFAEPVFGNSVVGQMARSVDDVRLLLGVLAGPDARDPLCPDPYPPLEWSTDASRRRLRIAFSPRLGLDTPVERPVARCVAGAVEALRARGCAIEQRDPVWPEGAGETGLMPLQLAGLAALYGDAHRDDPSRFDPDIARQIEAGLATTGAEVARALHLREALFRTLAEFLEPFDALITPTTPCTAWPLPDLGPSHIEGVPVDPRAHAAFTPIFNHTYLPACSVPCGLDGDGLPVGLQVVGARRFRDPLVLAIAEQVETATPHDFSVPRRAG